MDEKVLKRAREAYKEWNFARKVYRENNGDLSAMSKFVKRHGDFLQEITKDAAKDRRDVSIWKLIKEIKED